MIQTLAQLADASVEASVVIDRPVADVFGFYRDFTNMPRFLGDVMAVEPTAPATFRWTIQGPAGIQVKSTIRVTDERPDALIRYETTVLPGLAGQWTVSFSPGPGANQTGVREVLKVPFGKVGLIALSFVGKPPGAEVAANLRRLKQLIETGVVTDTDHAVAGKFDRRSPGQ